MRPAMATCRQAREAMLEVATGTTGPDLRLALAGHLARCAPCRREAAALEEVAALLRAVPEPHLGPSHWDDFMARLDRALALRRRSPLARLARWLRSPRHAWGAALATAGAAVAMALALWGGGAAPPPPSAQEPVQEEVLQGVPVQVPLQQLMTPSMLDAQPAMDASLSVWKAGFGSGDVPYDLVGGR